jgi:hypothetical protein
MPYWAAAREGAQALVDGFFSCEWYCRDRAESLIDDAVDPATGCAAPRKLSTSLAKYRMHNRRSSGGTSNRPRLAAGKRARKKLYCI